MIGSPKKDENAKRDSFKAKHDEPIEKQEFNTNESIIKADIVKNNSEMPLVDEEQYTLNKNKVRIISKSAALNNLVSNTDHHFASQDHMRIR